MKIYYIPTTIDKRKVKKLFNRMLKKEEYLKRVLSFTTDKKNFYSIYITRDNSTYTYTIDSRKKVLSIIYNKRFIPDLDKSYIPFTYEIVDL